MTERPLTASALARSYGFTPRHWIRLAAQGRIPGARQPFGPRGRWVFDASIFKSWWAAQQREIPQWPGYTREAASGGRVPSVTAETSTVSPCCSASMAMILRVGMPPY